MECEAPDCLAVIEQRQREVGNVSDGHILQWLLVEGAEKC